MLDVLARHGNGDVAELDRFSHQYPGWFLMISESASVASRSRLRSGNSAFNTCASRAWSPFHPAGARSRTVRSISRASAALSSSVAGHLKLVAAIEARLLKSTMASDLPYRTAGTPASGSL